MEIDVNVWVNGLKIWPQDRAARLGQALKKVAILWWKITHGWLENPRMEVSSQENHG